MPKDKDGNEIAPAKEALPSREDTLERENTLLRSQIGDLENLVLNGPLLTQPDLEVKPVGKEVTPANTTKDEKLTPEEIIQKSVDRVKKEIVEPSVKAADKQQAIIDLTALRADPKTKDVDIYIDEMKAVAAKNPTMGLKDVYLLAKAKYGPKAPPKEKVEPNEVDTGKIRSTEGVGRFSEVPKVKTRADATAVWGKNFNDAVEEGLRESGLG